MRSMRMIVGVGLLALLISFVAFSVGAQATEKFGGTLTIAMAKGAMNLDPALMLDVPSADVIEQIFDSVVVYDQKTNLIPSVAESWENPEPLQWIFHIRQGITFHNGEKLDATDVAYSFNRYLDPALDVPRKRLFMVEKVEVLDAWTVKVTLNQPFAPFLTVLTGASLSIVPKDLLESKAQELGGVKEAANWFSKHPVGSGPFKFVSWKKEVSIILERNENYWLKKPYLKKVVLRPIPESSVVTVELMSGGVDLSEAIATDDIPRMQDDPDLVLSTVPGLNYFYMAFNLMPASGENSGNIVAAEDTGVNPFRDIRVRKAVYYAVDFDSIIKSLFPYGIAGQHAYGQLPPSMSAFYDPVLTEYTLPYDPEKAKELIKEAGYPDGFKTRIFAPNDPRREAVAVTAQTYLKAIGIDAEVKTLAWSVYLPQLASGDMDMFILGWGMSPDPYDVMWYLFHSSNWGPPGNRQRYKNERVDELLVKATAEVDVSKRRAMYDEAQEIIASEYPHVPLYHLNEVNVYNNRVHDYQAHPTGGFKLVTPYNNVWLEK